MGTFLAYLLKGYMWLKSSWLGRMFLKYVKDKIMAIVKKLLWRRKNRRENAEETKKQTAKLQSPETDTKEEIDEAIDDALSKL